MIAKRIGTNIKNITKYNPNNKLILLYFIYHNFIFRARWHRFFEKENYKLLSMEEMNRLLFPIIFCNNSYLSARAQYFAKEYKQSFAELTTASVTRYEKRTTSALNKMKAALKTKTEQK